MSNEPVQNASSLSALLIVMIKAGVVLATAMGWVQWDTAQQAAVNGFSVAALDVVAVLVPMLWARSKVTPLAAPRDNEGVPLVRVDGQPVVSE